MKDVQNSRDTRNVYINEVGIKNLVMPAEIRNIDGDWIPVTARIGLFADLPAEQKGTHMSRFIQILQKNRRLELKNLRDILEDVRTSLDAASSYMDVAFDYFVRKTSPVSKLKSYMNVDVSYRASLQEDRVEFFMTVRTPVTTLCPCSKEISDYSAHNQRAIVSITIHTEKFVWIDDLVRIAEDSASSPLYPLLKRPDEKFVTEYAYDHPMFVEDVAREAKLRLDEMADVLDYSVEVESQESIHNHNAFARISSSKGGER